MADLAPVDVSTLGDPDDLHPAPPIIDAVEHAVIASPQGPEAGQIARQRLAQTRFRGEGPQGCENRPPRLTRQPAHILRTSGADHHVIRIGHSRSEDPCRLRDEHAFCYIRVVMDGVMASPGPIALLRSAAAALAAEACEDQDLTRLRGALCELRRQIDLLEGEFVRRVGVVDRRRDAGGAGAGAAGEAPSLVGWLRSSCRLSAAAAVERVEVSRQLSELPLTERALAQGEIGYEHARVIARAATEMGPAVARVAEAALVASAQEVDPGRLRDVALEVRQTVDPDGSLAAARRAHERRRLRLSRRVDGSFQLEGLLDAEGGATVATSLNALMTPVPGDTRTPDQRRADAIVELCRRSLQAGRLGHGAGQRPHLVLTVPAATLAGDDAGAGAGPADGDGAGRPNGAAAARAAAGPAELRWAGAVPAETARRLACDAAVRVVKVNAAGTPLDVGRATRSTPPSLRRALELRDRGCRFPGCDRPPEWTSAHHLWHWARGGPTRLDNLVLLCQRCHTLVHEERWRLRWGPGGELLAEPP